MQLSFIINLILFLICVSCIIIAKECNGKGPEYGVLGLLAYAMALVFSVATFGMACYNLGKILR